MLLELNIIKVNILFDTEFIVLFSQMKINGVIMKTEKNILTAFILNLAFSIFEFLGGIFTGSIAIISDSIHDIGDASSIGISYFLERKSKKQPDDKYTYGYTRYSAIGGFITTLILLIGSILVIYNAIKRIVFPTVINYSGMIIFAILGVIINSLAAFFTRVGDSLNQKAVNLHMLEDVLGWIVVLIGAVVMKFTDFTIIDPLMSIGVALFILITSVKNLCEIFALFLEKVPDGISVQEIKEHLTKIKCVLDVHHIHIWSMDGQHNYATLHIVTDTSNYDIKEKIREELREHGIFHSTLEFEKSDENCSEKECHIEHISTHHHHHHH